MLPSKAKVQTGSRAGGAAPAKKGKGDDDKPKIPDLESLLTKRDYQGSIALLQFKRHANRNDVRNLEWLAYCHFHFGEHDKALKVYKDLLAMADPDPLYHTYAAACYYYMGLYKEAESTALQGPRCPLQLRILFHVAHKQGDEAKLMQHHQQLTESIEDQLSLASIHFHRSHFQEATDIYKRLLMEHREFLALNVYVALCYCKLDYYDVSSEILQVYLDKYPDSAVAANLKACNTFRMYNGKAAENDLKQLSELSGGTHLEHGLIRHNLVVFRGGENALQYLPAMDDTPQEARLNLVIHHLRHGELGEAYDIVKDLEPTAPQEYILKGVVHACMGQAHKGTATDQLKTAQQYFQLVGASASECDTIPGRQCMASCFFLLKQFDDVLVFLQSIKSYFPNDDDFNWNYGIAKAAVGKYKEAEETLSSIQSEKYRSEACFMSWLSRCYIMNGRPRMAWELYLRQEASEDSYALLQLIANDCYKMGAFFYAAKAFDVLERLDPAPEYVEGKKGACVGTFQAIIAGKEPKDSLRDVVAMLRSSAAANAQVETCIRVMRVWAKENGIHV